MRSCLSIGIFIFFFLIGLEELDIRGFLSAVRGRLFLAAVLSVTISLLVSLAVTTDVLIDLGTGPELHRGACASRSAVSVEPRRRRQGSDGRRAAQGGGGRAIFTAVVIAELLALFVVGFAISEQFDGGAEGAPALDLLSVAIVVGQILAFAVATWFISTRILPRVIVLLHRFLQVPQLSFGLLLGGLFLVVVAAEEVGLHGSLGALLFGAALSILPYQVRRDIMPGLRSAAEGLFVPLFFASAGLHLTLDSWICRP